MILFFCCHPCCYHESSIHYNFVTLLIAIAGVSGLYSAANALWCLCENEHDGFWYTTREEAVVTGIISVVSFVLLLIII